MRDFRDIFDYQKDPRGTFMLHDSPFNYAPISPWYFFNSAKRGASLVPSLPGPGSLKHRPELRGVDGAVVEISLMSLALRPRRCWPGVGHGMVHLGWKHGTKTGRKRGRDIGWYRSQLNENITRLELPWHVLGVAVAVPGSWVPGWSHKKFVTFCFSTQTDFWWPCLGIPYFWHLMQGCICWLK